MQIPKDSKQFLRFALDLVEICKVSQGQRSAVYRTYGQWIETGRAAGGLALANLLYSHICRLSSHLYSPGGLKFSSRDQKGAETIATAMNNSPPPQE